MHQSKKQIAELLSKDELYSGALKKLGDNERNKINSFIEPMFVDTMSAINEFTESVKNNPEFAAQLRKAFVDNGLIIDSQSNVSGTTGT